MYQVDNSLYEAADIEGATKFQKFRFVTLPLIRPIFIFSIMIIIIWSIPTFDYVWILTQGGPAYSSEVLATNLYSQAFDRFNVGYSSAIGTLMFIYTIFIVKYHLNYLLPVVFLSLQNLKYFHWLFQNSLIHELIELA